MGKAADIRTPDELRDLADKLFNGFEAQSRALRGAADRIEGMEGLLRDAEGFLCDERAGAIANHLARQIISYLSREDP